MIQVTGATGQYGTHVIKHLLSKGLDTTQLSALVRDIAKAKFLKDQGIELRVGDYGDEESLVNAFQNVDKLLLVSSNDHDLESRTTHHENVIRAAKTAGVKHIVYTSFVRKVKDERSAIAAFQESHRKTEQWIKDSGMTYTLMQNGIYLEMIPVFGGEKAVETGVILLAAQDGKASWVLREELAEVAAHVLTTEGHENKTYTLTNVESTSFGDIAQELSDTLGKEVHYQSLPAEAFQATLKHFGVPDLYIGLFAGWSAAQAQGELDVRDDTLAHLLGRKPTTTRQFIQQVYG